MLRRDMKTREALLTRISAFLLSSGLTEHRFGMAAAGDHKFIRRLRHRNVTLERIERAERFMAEWPDGPSRADASGDAGASAS